MRLLLFIAFLCSQFFFSQSQIVGTIKSDSANFVKANVILLNEKNEIETFGFSKKDGSFSLAASKPGNFKVQITAFNYNEQIIDLAITGKEKTYDLGKITLNHLKEHEIKEVIITRDRPIRIGRDTIEYKAAKFATGTEMNVEDLLKKLPGIKVNTDGTIKFGNKEVELF